MNIRILSGSFLVNACTGWLLGTLAILLATNALAAESAEADPRQVWQLLDYIAVDYREAVHDGQVINGAEYAEMREFASSARTQLATLPEKPVRSNLTDAAGALIEAIDTRSAPDQVAHLARKLADELLQAYPVPLAPTAVPDLNRGRVLYETHCSGCHGAAGAGDGPLARTLNPPPIAFTDAARSRVRTPFSYYQVITQGIAGTSMGSFAALPEPDRWSLAFFAGTLAYSDAQRRAGERLWLEEPNLRAVIPNLESIARSSEEDFAAKVGQERAGALAAFLRSRPDAFSARTGASLVLARARLTESVNAYQAGRSAEAQRLALSAYLDGIEPIEPQLATSHSELMLNIEAAMAAYRANIARGAATTDLSTQAQRIEELLSAAEQALSATAMDATTAFLGSFTILLREGVEALLIVVAIVAFLGKAQRADLLRYVHTGWVAALVAGVLTWGVATYLVSISGAQREITEGLSSLFAAVVLLSVGLWMHSKSLAGRWQQYLQEKLSHTLTHRSAWFLAGLAFVAVYREVFETILFYAALWTQGAHRAILAGLLAAALCLVAVTFVLLRASRRLPVSQFFSISSVFIGVLAVVLVGKGVAALQEAGWLGLRPFPGPRVDVLGIYPNLQVLLAQVVMLGLTIGGFLYNYRGAARKAGVAR